MPRRLDLNKAVNETNRRHSCRTP